MVWMQELSKECLVLDTGNQLAVVKVQLLLTPDEYKEFLNNVNDNGEIEVELNYGKKNGQKSERARETEKKAS